MPWSPWSLLVPPALARLLRRRPAGGPLDRWDLLLCLVLGGLAAGVGGGWLAAFPLPRPAVVGSPDFAEYCAYTATWVFDRAEDWGRNRSRLAGLPAGLLAPHVGVLDGLLLSALLSLGALASGLYLWGRALHGRAAGVAAALVALAMAPVVLLGRTLTFYPVIAAATVLAAAGGAVAVRWRTPGALLLAGAGAGLALLVDARGLLWALPVVGLALLAALVGPPGARRAWRGIPLRLVALAAPLVVAWHLGPWAYVEGARSLEGHVAVYDELRTRGWDLPPYVHPTGVPTDYVWGRSDLREVPWTLAYLADQGCYVPQALKDSPQVRQGRARSVDPWLPALGTAGVLALVGLRRRPGLVLALVGTSLPFLVALNGALVVKLGNLRFVGSAMLALPLLLGVGAGVLVEGALPAREPVRAPPPWAPLALGAVLLALVLGAVPSFLSPVAPWRAAWPPAEGALRKVLDVHAGRAEAREADTAACARAIAAVPGDGTLLARLPGASPEP